jgi:hypothetical protein
MSFLGGSCSTLQRLSHSKLCSQVDIRVDFVNGKEGEDLAQHQKGNRASLVLFMELTVCWKICEATSIMLQQSSLSLSSSSYNFQLFHITQKLINYPEKTATGRLQYLLI